MIGRSNDLEDVGRVASSFPTYLGQIEVTLLKGYQETILYTSYENIIGSHQQRFCSLMENGILKTEIESFEQNLIGRIDILNLLIFSIVSSKPKKYNALKIP